MTQRKPYRSALRSKAWIREAFLQLLREKDYEKITVTDIVNRAGINRSTFYAHYSDVFALVEEIRDEVLEAAVGPLQELDGKSIFTDPQPYLEMMANQIRENRELYSLLGKTDLASMQLDFIKEYLIQNSLEKLDKAPIAQDRKVLQLRITFFVSGIMDVYLKWILGQIDCSLEDISQAVAHLITESVPTVLGLEIQ